MDRRTGGRTQGAVNPEAMQQAGRKISLMMGLILSFFQSLIGNLTSGHFALPSWLLSFAISVAVSWVIGFLVPIGKLGMSAARKAGFAPGTLKARLLQACVSDCIFSPVISLVNVLLAYFNAKSHGAPVSFPGMYLPSLGLSLAAGFVLVFIFQPICAKIALKDLRETRNDTRGSVQPEK